MKKAFSALLAFILLFAFSVSACAEGLLRPLVDSAQALLFATDNVTLSGHAVFSLEGERFKTADILYKQDGTRSHWQMDLLTPRLYRTDRETGYTIIANGEKIYVMERYYPGVYQTGSDHPNDTVIRRSVQSDQLVSMALSMADALETVLPENALTVVSDSSEGRELQISLSGNTVPGLLNASLNLAAEFALRRFMDVDYDREIIFSGSEYTSASFEDYPTVTTAILYGADHFTLSSADIQLRLDGSNRPESASGAVSVLLSFPEDEDMILDITFELAASDYGTTVVPMFDPDLYQVIPAGSGEPVLIEVDPALAEKLSGSALESLKAAGYDTEALSYDHTEEDDGFYYSFFRHADTQTSVCGIMNEDGQLLQLWDSGAEYYSLDPHEPSEGSLSDETCRKLSAFLEQAFPDLVSRCSTFVPIIEYEDSSARYLYVITRDQNGGYPGISFVIIDDPDLKIIAYDCLDL